MSQFFLTFTTVPKWLVLEMNVFSSVFKSLENTRPLIFRQIKDVFDDFDLHI